MRLFYVHWNEAECKERVRELRRAGHVVGQLRCALLPTPFHPQQDQTDNAGGNDQDHNHCHDDGGHEHPFQTVDVKRNGEGTVLQVVQSQLLCVRCQWNSSRAIVCQAKITMS